MTDSINFYYVRNKLNQPIACVAISELDDRKIARGVSICSKKDRFSKTVARKIAAHRLSQAIQNESSFVFGEYTGQKSLRPNESYELPELHFKMAYKINPTAYEDRILHKPE